MQYLHVLPCSTLPNVMYATGYNRTQPCVSPASKSSSEYFPVRHFVPPTCLELRIPCLDLPPTPPRHPMCEHSSCFDDIEISLKTLSRLENSQQNAKSADGLGLAATNVVHQIAEPSSSMANPRASNIIAGKHTNATGGLQFSLCSHFHATAIQTRVDKRRSSQTRRVSRCSPDTKQFQVAVQQGLQAESLRPSAPARKSSTKRCYHCKGTDAQHSYTSTGPICFARMETQESQECTNYLELQRHDVLGRSISGCLLDSS